MTALMLLPDGVTYAEILGDDHQFSEIEWSFRRGTPEEKDIRVRVHPSWDDGEQYITIAKVRLYDEQKRPYDEAFVLWHEGGGLLLCTPPLGEEYGDTDGAFCWINVLVEELPLSIAKYWLPLRHIREANGELPVSSKEGHPFWYTNKEEMLVLCGACANTPEHWTDAEKYDVNWEHFSLYCEGCGKLVSSAYGEEK